MGKEKVGMMRTECVQVAAWMGIGIQESQFFSFSRTGEYVSVLFSRIRKTGIREGRWKMLRCFETLI
jgi:hypothetical protein